MNIFGLGKTAKTVFSSIHLTNVGQAILESTY